MCSPTWKVAYSCAAKTGIKQALILWISICFFILFVLIFTPNLKFPKYYNNFYRIWFIDLGRVNEFIKASRVEKLVGLGVLAQNQPFLGVPLDCIVQKGLPAHLNSCHRVGRRGRRREIDPFFILLRAWSIVIYHFCLFSSRHLATLAAREAGNSLARCPDKHRVSYYSKRRGKLALGWCTTMSDTIHSSSHQMFTVGPHLLTSRHFYPFSKGEKPQIPNALISSKPGTPEC